MLKQKIAPVSYRAAFLFAAAIASDVYAALPEYTLQPYSPGVYYTGIHLNDMDGDGRREVLIGNRTTSSVEIWRYNPATEMLERIDTIGFPYHVHDIKAADLDGDGDKDLVVGLRAYGLYVAINQGGSWSTPHIDGTYSWQVLLADFNGDGHLDIFDGVDWQLAKVFYGDGSGGFALGPSPPRPFAGYNAPLGLNVADLNNDGRPDLIGPTVELPEGCFLRAYLNTDAGGVVNWTSVGPAATSAAAGCPASRLDPSAGDLDGNGYTDQAAFSPAGDILISEGGTSGGNLVWTPRTLATLSTGAASIGVADLNGDGHLDVHVEGSNLFNGINVYLGDGSGNFTPASLPLDHGVGGFNALQTGDINGDGLMDIVTARNVAGSPSGYEVLYQVGNTPIGSNVLVNPDVNVSVTFSQVTQAGNTTAIMDTTNPGTEKSGFKFLGTYYDINTTAVYTGPVTVCLNYDDAGIPGNREQKLKIFHWDGADWINATSSLDTTNNIICGTVASLSWLAAAYELYVYSGVLQPINADGSSIFRLGSTVPVKFQLWDADGNFVTNALARIYLTKISDDIAGNETEAASTSAATEGNLFRYDSVANQYIFNLSTKSLSTGTWQLRILLDDGTSKYVALSLR
jgi:hypothetical protein